MVNIKIDLVGQKFGKLTVKSPAYIKDTHWYWNCECECGNTSTPCGTSLRLGTAKSCGCSQNNNRRLQAIKRRAPKGVSGLHRLYRTYKRNATNRHLSFELTKEQFKKLTSSNCYYCGIKPTQSVYENDKTMTLEGIENARYIYNGIDRIDNNQGYLRKNCRACCKKCNNAKKKMTEKEFYQWLKQAYEYSKSQGNL